MTDITWLEVILIGAFAGTLAFSIAFCTSNYRSPVLDEERRR
ncbi:hypothetical protein [Methylococcus sp. EFPC2]|nr:hypothetical protein [Methylococcus sp. EFPC2]